MIVTTTERVPGRKVATIHGIVRGYTELSTESRERAKNECCRTPNRWVPMRLSASGL